MKTVIEFARKNRIVIAILCLILAVAAFSVALRVENTPAEAITAEVIAEGTTVGISIVNTGEQKYYRFIPTVNGEYTYYSSGAVDSYGFVYDAKGNMLISDDDSGYGKNFSILYSLTAGQTYYLGAKMFNGDIGSFSIRVVKTGDFTPDPIPCVHATGFGYTLYDAEYHTEICLSCGEGIQVPHVYHDDNDYYCNHCGYARYLPADYDANGEVDTHDAEYMLYHIFFGAELYPIPSYQPLRDFNADGLINSDDAICLYTYIESPYSLVYIDAIAPTCTTEGKEGYWYCADSGKYYADSIGLDEIDDLASYGIIAARGHDEFVYHEAIDADCVNGGNTAYYTCARCQGYFADEDGNVVTSLEEVSIPAIGHDYQFGAFVWNTSTPGAYSAQVRLICSDNDEHIAYKDISVDMRVEIRPHIPEIPSCLVERERIYTATFDGHTDIKSEIIPGSVPGHNYVVVAHENATCTEDGYTTYSCTVCHDTKTIAIIALGHYFGYDNVCDRCGYGYEPHIHSYTATVTEPGCTTIGFTTYTCECGANYKDHYTEPLGHCWDDGVVTTEKTCTTDGEMTFTCDRCDMTKTERIPAGHEWTETVLSQKTCTEDGIIYKLCSVCSAEEYIVDPAAHTWNAGEIIEDSTCTAEGSKKYTCTVCGEEKIEIIPKKGHHFVNGVCTICNEPWTATPNPDHPEYGMYFLVDTIRSAYGPEDINEYGVLLYVNADAEIDRVGVYLTQDGTMWRRCIACTGNNIEFAYYVPYLSYGTDILYTGLNHNSINTFRLERGADGIWRYSEYATIGVNLADYRGNLLLSLYDIGQAGAKTMLFNDLSLMKAWLKGEDINTPHVHTVVIDPEIPPTCVRNGLSEGSHCSVCGEVIVARTVITAPNHDYRFSRFVWSGYTAQAKYICANDNSHIKYETATVTNEVTTPETCTSSGVRTYTASYEGHTDTKTALIPSPGHNYIEIERVEATCTTRGYIKYKCENCEDIYYIYMYSSHNYQETDREPASCTEDGYITYTCSNCGHSYDEIIPAGDHEYEVEIVTEPTYETTGIRRYTCIHCSYSFDEVIPVRRIGTRRVLLVQNRLAWTENSNANLLNDLTDDDYIIGWDLVTAENFDTVDLDEYSVIYIAGNDQYPATYNILQNYTDELEAFADNGGVVIYGACDHGWTDGDVFYTLPGGVRKGGNYYSYYNYIKDGGHPIVTGELTDGTVLTDSILYCNYSSHVYFTNLPEDANVIFVDGNGQPTLVEYPYGGGRIILSGLTWEFAYVRNLVGSTSYAKCVYDDLIVYAVECSDPIVHAYEADHTVDPTCTARGYTVYICMECGKMHHDDYIPALGHNMTHTATVPATCTTEGKKEYWYCSRCDKYYADSIGSIQIDNLSSYGILPILEHAYGTPTSISSSQHKYSCTRCTYSYTESHHITSRMTTQLGNNTDGVRTYTCSDCGYSYTEIVRSLTISGKVTIADNDADETNNRVLSGATIRITSTSLGIDYSATSASNGTFTIYKLMEGTYSLSVSKSGYQTVTQNITLNYLGTTIQIPTFQLVSNVIETGRASGYVKDAATGNVLSNITVYVRNGWNVTTGAVVETLTTNSSGQWQTSSLQSGYYTMQMVDRNTYANEDYRYGTTSINVTITGNTTVTNQNTTMTRSLQNVDSLRVVLTWGSTPSDLDSHMQINLNSGNSYHIYYSNKNPVTWANLDVDDTTSYGPETITTTTSNAGTYTYYVHDYTNRSSNNSSALSNSGAIVKIYVGSSSQPMYQFSVPSGLGTYWKVFTYNSVTGEFTFPNTISSSAG